jgi:hypothetical protein
VVNKEFTISICNFKDLPAVMTNHKDKRKGREGMFEKK